jgi:hypothetical protein
MQEVVGSSPIGSTTITLAERETYAYRPASAVRLKAIHLLDASEPALPFAELRDFAHDALRRLCV